MIGICFKSFSAVVEGAEKVVRFVADGGNDRFIA